MTPLPENEKDTDVAFKESRDIDASKTTAVDEPTKIQLLLLEQVKELKQYINNQAILYSDSERRTMQEIIRLHEIIKRLKMENERLLERQDKLKALKGIENCIFPSDDIEAAFEMSVEDFSSFHSSWDGTNSSEGEIALENTNQVEHEKDMNVLPNSYHSFYSNGESIESMQSVPSFLSNTRGWYSSLASEVTEWSMSEDLSSSCSFASEDSDCEDDTGTSSVTSGRRNRPRMRRGNSLIISSLQEELQEIRSELLKMKNAREPAPSTETKSEEKLKTGDLEASFKSLQIRNRPLREQNLRTNAFKGC